MGLKFITEDVDITASHCIRCNVNEKLKMKNVKLQLKIKK